MGGGGEVNEMGVSGRMQVRGELSEEITVGEVYVI